MNLGDFLTSVPKPSAPTERVTFWAIHQNITTLVKTPVRVFASFDLVSDKDEQAAELAALKALQQSQGEGGLVPAGLPEALERAHFLEAALRNFDSPTERFATAAELQRSIPRRELRRLMAEYVVWADKNYPKNITKEDRAGVKDEAAKK